MSALDDFDPDEAKDAAMEARLEATDPSAGTPDLSQATPSPTTNQLEKETIQTILLAYDNPHNNGAGHHNVVFTERRIKALLASKLKELESKAGTYTKVTVTTYGKKFHTNTIVEATPVKHIQEMLKEDEDG